MSSAPAHDHNSDQVALYVLQALPRDEVPVVEAHISTCAECRLEVDTLRPIIDAFVSWPTDVLRPAASLWGRLAQRIGAETDGEEVVSPPAPYVEPEWKDVARGIACKLLAIDAERQRVSMLVRLAAGADYPPHRHDDVEELHLLHGELIVDDQTFYPGDFRRMDPGTIDHRVWSETGCTCVLITSFRDAIL